MTCPECGKEPHNPRTGFCWESKSTNPRSGFHCEHCCIPQLSTMESPRESEESNENIQ